MAVRKEDIIIGSLAALRGNIRSHRSEMNGFQEFSRDRSLRTTNSTCATATLLRLFSFSYSNPCLRVVLSDLEDDRQRSREFHSYSRHRNLNHSNVNTPVIPDGYFQFSRCPTENFPLVTFHRIQTNSSGFYGWVDDTTGYSEFGTQYFTVAAVEAIPMACYAAPTSLT